MTNKFSDEEVMAFADGQLDAVRARQLEGAAKTDPELRSRIGLFQSTAGLAKSAWQGFADDVSPNLQARVEALLAKDLAKEAAGPAASNVVQLAERRVKHSWFIPSTIAASVALLFGYGAAHLQSTSGSADLMALGAIQSDDLATALATTATGQSVRVGGSQVSLVASFKDGGNHLCREFEVARDGAKSNIAVACRHGALWETLIVVAGASSQDSYTPASATQTLDAFLQSISAGSPLTDSEELQALEKLR